MQDKKMQNLHRLTSKRRKHNSAVFPNSIIMRKHYQRIESCTCQCY